MIKITLTVDNDRNLEKNELELFALVAAIGSFLQEQIANDARLRAKIKIGEEIETPIFANLN